MFSMGRALAEYFEDLATAGVPVRGGRVPAGERAQLAQDVHHAGALAPPGERSRGPRHLRVGGASAPLAFSHAHSRTRAFDIYQIVLHLGLLLTEHLSSAHWCILYIY